MSFSIKFRTLRISNLLILSALIACCCCCFTGASALDLKKSLSFVGLAGLDGHASGQQVERVIDPLNYADDSLITRSGKSNKVSKLLRFIHNKAGDAVYHRNDPAAAKAATNTLSDIEDHLFEPIVGQSAANQAPDDEVIASVCVGHQGMTCKYAVKTAMRTRPEERAIIANAIRHKPAHVDGSKLLYHKLFESAIAKAEERNLDEKIDFGINLLAKKSPYGWAATTALDMATKKL